jgi:hypothetical protein
MVEWVPKQFPLIGAARREDYSDNHPRVRYFLWEGLLVNKITTTADLTNPPLRRGELCDHRLRGGPRSPNFLTAYMPIALVGEFPVLPPHPRVHLVHGFANRHRGNANPPPEDSLYSMMSPHLEHS